MKYSLSLPLPLIPISILIWQNLHYKCHGLFVDLKDVCVHKCTQVQHLSHHHIVASSDKETKPLMITLWS